LTDLRQAADDADWADVDAYLEAGGSALTVLDVPASDRTRQARVNYDRRVGKLLDLPHR